MSRDMLKTGSNRYTGGLRTSILAHIRKPTACHGRAELDFNFYQIYFVSVYNTMSTNAIKTY